jgi:hypothetical protein
MTITPTELLALAQSAQWTGKKHFQQGFELAAARIRELEKRLGVATAVSTPSEPPA